MKKLDTEENNNSLASETEMQPYLNRNTSPTKFGRGELPNFEED